MRRIRSLQRTLLAVIVGVLIAGACASDSSPDSADPDNEAKPAEPNQCGADETAVCEGSTLGVEEVAELATEVGTPQFAAAVTELVEPLESLAEDCANISEWVIDVSDVATRLHQAAHLLDELDRIDEGESRAKAVTLAEWVEDALLLNTVCNDVSQSSDAAVEAAGQAVGAADAFRLAMTSASLSALNTRFWSSSDEIGHVLEAGRMLEEHGDIDVLLIGDSSVKWGFDPVGLSNSTGQVVANFGIEGFPTTLYQHWVDELSGLGVAPDAVVVGISSWGSLIACDDIRKQIYEDRSTERRGSFRSVGALEDLDPSERTPRYGQVT